MKISSLSLIIGAVSIASPALADTNLSGAIYSNNAILTPSVMGTDAWIYEETTPGNLTLTNSGSQLNAVLGGYAAAPGGNVELFPQSETSAYTSDSSASSAFANTVPVKLTGTAGSTAFAFRSLNGNDWFGSASGYNNTYGADTLATAWFNGFVDSVASLIPNPVVAAGLNAARADLFADWRDSGAFASLSDPNIGYVYENAGQLNFGLEGFLDASPRFREFLAESGYAAFAAFVPDGIQYSEVVMLNDEAYYSFLDGTASGVQLDDAPFNSYTADFAFAVVPEPSSMALLGAAGVLTFFRRRR
jgi:hypothetical protein